MKKVRNFALMATAILFGMTSCSNDDKELNEGNNASGNMSVMLRLDGSSNPNPESRAVGTGADQQLTELSSGQIVFAKTNGTVRFVYTLSTAATDLDNNVVNIGDLTTAGVNFPKVDGEYVHIIGNKTIALSTGSNLTTELAKAGNRLGKADLGVGDYKKVALYGSSKIKNTTDDGPNGIGSATHYAEVTITPLSSRIEIAKINQTNTKYTYKLGGIFINNYYKEMIIGATTGDDILNNGQDDTKYTDAIYGGGGTSTWHDMINAPAPLNPNAPAVGNVWAYNVFPAANKTAPVEDNVPHIIVHLKDVKVGGITKYADYYLTIATYNVEEFEAGKVYTIGELKFDLDKNGDDKPETKKFDCDVKVTIQKWTAEPLIPNVN